MADLYTSLSRLKQSLNDGQLPPMTPLPKHIKKHIDPALTIAGNGWGGVVEDEEKGLLCPVRGCGEWHVDLTAHTNAAHKEIGGAEGFKALMSIPTSTPLIAQSAMVRREVRREERQDAAMFRALPRVATPVVRRRRPKAAIRKQAATLRTVTDTVGYRNLRNECPRQIRDRILALYQEIGRTPSLKEFGQAHGKDCEKMILRVYGTWDNAIFQAGLPESFWARRKGIDYEHYQFIVDVLAVWYRRHGELPSEEDARRSDRLPLLPPYKAMEKRFHYRSWDASMKIVASLLNIYGGKYGLPAPVSGETTEP